MPSYGRRNNYSSRAGLQSFTGRGRVLGGRSSYPSILRGVSNLAAAAGLVGSTVGGAVTGRKYLKRKVSEMMRPSQKPMSTQRAKLEGSGGSISKFNYGRYQRTLPDSVYKTLMPSFYRKNPAFGRISSAVGLQNAQIIHEAFTGPDLAAIFGGFAGGKLLIEGVRGKAMLTNQSSSNCCITLYDIVTSKNESLSSVNNPIAAWREGVDQEGGISTDWQLPGVSPFSSDVFKQNYHILKKTDVILGQGVTHEHSIEFFPNRQVNQSVYAYMQGIADLTISCMAVFHGVPTNSVTTSTVVSTGEVDLDFTSFSEVSYRTLNASQSSYTIVNTTPLPLTLAGGENILNVATGTALPETHA